MAVTAIRRLAASQAAPVYPAIGGNAFAAVDDLRLQEGLSLQDSPRHASILLVAGEVRARDFPELRRLHDQLPHPRATVWWGDAVAPGFSPCLVLGVEDQPADSIAAVWRDLIAGTIESEPDLLPDEPPAPWRGEGDHGQGGEGMMGGKPYGRPMPMTDDDLRDGLALDRYVAPFGPFLAMFPPGLRLEIALQGDLVQTARVERPPYPQPEEPVRVAAFRSLARMLRLLGLEAHAHRFLRAAHGVAAGREPSLRSLERRLRWSGALRSAPLGLGLVQGRDVRGRLRNWWQAAAGQKDPDSLASHPSAPSARLSDLLSGLEWHEACLVLNSFDHATLRRICAAEPQAEDGGDG